MIYDYKYNDKLLLKLKNKSFKQKLNVVYQWVKEDKINPNTMHRLIIFIQDQEEIGENKRKKEDV